ncbi:MAG: hypothetical protein LBI76_12685, partial [Comamonas sp.]|nr:hypothetical protein [Comamonas sp.]
LCICLALVGCKKSLSAEEQAQVQALRTELDATQKEVSATELQNAKYSGGLVKAQMALRLETLKTNEALLQQRIHAIESGAKVTVETVATKADPDRAKMLQEEMTKQELKVSEAEAKASLSSGGLAGTMAVIGAATERNSLALLRQQYLVAKYGLASPQLAASSTNVSSPSSETTPIVADKDLSEQILEAKLLQKKYAKQDYQDYVFFDVAFNPSGLDKPARAIKGVLILTDLFGEQKFAVNWTIEKPVIPGTEHVEKGYGFRFNQFIESHQWARNTDKDNMKLKFRVNSILYQDGSSRTFDE